MSKWKDEALSITFLYTEFYTCKMGEIKVVNCGRLNSWPRFLTLLFCSMVGRSLGMLCALANGQFQVQH